MKKNTLDCLVAGMRLPGMPAATTPVSLTLNDGLSVQQWAEIGAALYRRGQSMTWWLADWAAFGERKYGKLKQFCEVNEINHGTMRNLAAVASSVQLSRRRDNLSFSHHVEVAPLKPKEQSKWLAIAVREKLSVSELRKRIRLAQAEHGPEKTFGPPAAIFAVEQFFLDGDVFLERNASTLEESKDYLWTRAQPLIQRAAKLWPEKISLK